MKHLHPKIRQKKKKWTIEQLSELIPLTITKYLNRICKQIKTLLILKTTKKITQSREQPSLQDEYEKEIEHLKQFKLIHHTPIAKFLAKKLFPDEIHQNEAGGDDDDEEEPPPSNEIIQLFQQHPKFHLTLKEIKEKIHPLITERENLLQKQRNIELNQQRQSQSNSNHNTKTSVKQAAVKAIFLDSLGGEEDEEENEGNNEEEDEEVKQRREQWKIERSLRNQQNRQKNREHREKEAAALQMYMPADQRTNGINSQNEKKPSIQRNRKPLRESNSSFQNSQGKREREPERKQFTEVQNMKRQKFEQPANANEDESKLKTLASVGKEWKSTGLHPSWAAKQLQKTQISIAAVPQGKKIVFEEE